MLITRPAQREDAVLIEPVLQEYSRAELLAYVALGHEVKLIQLFLKSAVEAHIVLDDEAPIVMFGYTVSYIASDRVHPWAVWSDEVERFTIKSVRIARQFYDDLVHNFGLVQNFCREDNVHIHKWQRLMGCQVLRNIVYYSNLGVPLLEYERRA